MTAPSNKYILVSIEEISLDGETDAVQVSSVTGVEGVFSYTQETRQGVNGFVSLYFQTNEVVINFQTDSFWNHGHGFATTLYETNGNGELSHVSEPF